MNAAAEIELFTCPRHAGNLRLMPSSCADMWRRGRRAHREDTLWHCRGCEIGARHAGLKIATAKAATEADTIAGDDTCIRCGKRPNRLVSKALCIGCYNRCCEFVKGLNARGLFPKCAKPLHKFRATLTLPNDESKAVAAWTCTLRDFIAIVLRQYPDAQIAWPSLTSRAVEELSRTNIVHLPRPYLLYLENPHEKHF